MIITRSTLLTLGALSLVPFTLVHCGGLSADKDGPADSAAASQAPSQEGSEQEDADRLDKQNKDVIYLKGAALLSRTFIDTIGPSSDVNVLRPSEHLFETFRGNFGGNEGLSYGSVYANSLDASNKMTSYFMGLAYISYNAGLQCNMNSRAGKCRCDTPESALAMLSRAIPYIDFTLPEHASLVSEFRDLCAENYVYAVSSLMSSVPVAKRN